MDCTMRSLVLVCTITFVSLIATNAEDIPIDRFAVQGGTIQLHCDLPVADDPDVEWVDRVYGSEQRPEKIFHSRNNQHFNVLETHQNGKNYRVNRKFALTISNVDMDSDVGQYTCRSRVGERVFLRNYYLTVGARPVCSGETNLRSGEETSLSCEMAYSGRNPNLDWLENGETVSSTDEYEIRLAKKVVTVRATHRHDGLVFRCQMALGGAVDNCNLTLNVTYGVHQPKFHPIKQSLEPGDEVKCTAKGNPVPSVALGPNFSGSVNGAGWSAFIVEESWVGQQIQVQCLASNTIDGIEHSKSQNFSFRVSEASRKDEHPHRHHHHHRHSTVPIVHAPDEENMHIAPGDHQIEEKNPVTPLEQKPQPQPNKPNVKPVRSNNSAGNLSTVSAMVTILSLIAAVLV